MSLNSTAIRGNPYPVQQTQTETQTQTQTPPAHTRQIAQRERLNDERFVSLAVSDPGKEHGSLSDALNYRLQRAQAQSNPPFKVVLGACTAILLLDQSDHVADCDLPTCQLAVNILMEEREYRLLQRLAEVTQHKFDVTGHPFVLHVGANSSHAYVLARIGDAWPEDVPVSLILSTNLPLDALNALSNFLRCTAKLSLQIHAESGTSSSASAHAFGQTLKGCSLVELSIVSGPHSVQLLQSMVGVQAQAIGVRVVDLPAEEPGTDNVLHDALTELVRSSGAQMLNVSGTSVQGVLSEGLALKLLNCRRNWACVQISPSNEVMKWLEAGQHRVGQLEVSGWRSVHSPLRVLHAAEMSRVHTIVFLGHVNVTSLAECLDLQLQTSMHVFEKIESGLSFRASEKDRMGQVVNSILSNPILVELVHRPAGPAEMEWEFIAPLVANALEAMGTAGRLETPSDRAQRAQRTAQQRLTEVVNTLGGLLAEARNASELVAYLHSPATTLIPAWRSTAPSGPQNEPLLAQKLRILDTCVPNRNFVRAAIALHLHSHSNAIPLVCRTLFELGFPKKVQSSQQWKALAVQHAVPNIGNLSVLQLSDENLRDVHADIESYAMGFAQIALPFKSVAVTVSSNQSDGSVEEGPVKRQKLIWLVDIVKDNLPDELVATTVVARALVAAFDMTDVGHAELAEALMHVGVISPAVWLREGLGIDVHIG